MDSSIMKTYKIEGLTLEELNTILQGLSQLPYFQVADLIRKVKTQGDKQFMGDTEIAITY